MSNTNYLSISYFNDVHLDLQAEEVFKTGNFVDVINGVVLYTYSNYLVECYYNVVSNEIEELIAISYDKASYKYDTDFDLYYELKDLQ